MRNSVPVAVDELKGMFKGVSLVPVTKGWSKLTGLLIQQGDTCLEVCATHGGLLEMSNIEEGDYEPKHVVEGRYISVACDTREKAEEVATALEGMGAKVQILVKRMKVLK